MSVIFYYSLMTFISMNRALPAENKTFKNQKLILLLMQIYTVLIQGYKTAFCRPQTSVFCIKYHNFDQSYLSAFLLLSNAMYMYVLSYSNRITVILQTYIIFIMYLDIFLSYMVLYQIFSVLCDQISASTFFQIKVVPLRFIFNFYFIFWSLHTFILSTFTITIFLNLV